MEEVTLAAVLSIFVLLSMSFVVVAAMYYFFQRIRNSNDLRASVEHQVKTVDPSDLHPEKVDLNRAMEALFQAREAQDGHALDAAIDALKKLKEIEPGSGGFKPLRKPRRESAPHSELGL